MSGMTWPWTKPLLSDEEFARVLEDDDDAPIWRALIDAAYNDPLISQVFDLSEVRQWSRFRTAMVCAYVMAQRHERMMQLELERLNTTLPKMYLCAKCGTGLGEIK